MPGAATVTVPSLRQWRIARMLRQTELAERAGVGLMSVHRGERGLPLQLLTVRKLAKALRVSPQALQQQASED